ncbi:MAG: VanZ family protein [Pirellulales bacterium]|nr:VanZ family protein [Pirellulales bacterium]
MNRGGSANFNESPPRRWHFVVAAVGYLTLAVYGSLVPLAYRALGWNEALTRFAEIRYLNLGIESRSDWVANILLFVPLAWLTMGALCVDRSLIWAALCAIVVAVTCHLLSWSIEFVQLYFPARTASVNDVVAESIGGTIGCVAWLVSGQAISNWCRRVWSLNRAASALPALVLLGYLFVLVLIHLMPMDLTISPAEVYRKFKAGRILPIPFSQVDRGREFAQGTIWNMIYFCPLGWLLAALRKADGSFRFGLLAIGGVGVLTTSAIEAMQLFVYSLRSDTTDIVTGTAAIVAGAAAARSWPAPAVMPDLADPPDRDATLGRRAVLPTLGRRGNLSAAKALVWLLPVAWCGALAVLNWWPFRFTTAPLPEAHGVPLPLWRARRIYWLPFKDYYWRGEFASFGQALERGVAFAALGAILAMAWHVRSIWLAVGFALFVASVLEFGQFFIVARYPSVSDVLVESLGAWCGFVLWQRWQRPEIAAIAISK